ncbi:hypothetical protein BD779DRAFT_1681311 [Infundibulicybe gibba]|nr:hypothetical protein BD779DRAFT_1681311 [Infundibulicybe gibba]
MATSTPLTQTPTPMPTPRSRGAPYFKGKDVKTFIKTLETLANAAHITHDNLPSLVLGYCSRKVRHILEESIEWNELKDWAKACEHLLDLYESNDRAPRLSVDRFRVWTKRHAKEGRFDKLQDVDEYYRDFIAISSRLLKVANPRINKAEVDILFYRGIPNPIRQKIKRKLPEKNLKSSAPPPLKTVLRLLREHFDDSDTIEDDSSGISDIGSDSDDPLSDSDEDISPTPPKAKKKTVRFIPPSQPMPPSVEPPTPQPIDELTKQMRDLVISQLADFKRDLQRDIVAQVVGPSNSTSNMNGKCFICGTSDHRLGLTNCPETKKLVEEGLAIFNSEGRLKRFDGNDLPRAPAAGGGVAKVLRDEIATLKGKARETRDRPPHMANAAGLQVDGEDVLTDEIQGIEDLQPASQFNVATGSSSYSQSSSSRPPSNWMRSPYETLPVTRSQTQKDGRVNPYQQPDKPQEKTPPVPQSSRQKPDAKKNEPGPQLVQPLPIQPSTKVPPKVTEPRANQNPGVPVGLAPHPLPPVPRPVAPVQRPVPHPANTEEAWRQKKSMPKVPVYQKEDADMHDGTSKTKPSSGYHFSSLIQDMTNGDEVQEYILNTSITIPLKQLIGLSPDMQKRFTNLTKTRREYASQAVVAQPDPEDEFDDCDGYMNSFGNQDSDNFGTSRVQLTYAGDREDVNDILMRYSSAVKVHTNPLFAMTTGRFEGTLGGITVTFMVDTGSELNLISQEFHSQTSLPLDMDGARWSLKGINGGPVPLVGCVRDADIQIGGHRFDHHFFVSSQGAGKQDVILGQPWLQWYSGAIFYSRTGRVRMNVWANGDADPTEDGRCRRPTLSIQLCAVDASRNVDRLVMKGQCPGHHQARIEEVILMCRKTGSG